MSTLALAAATQRRLRRRFSRPAQTTRDGWPIGSAVFVPIPLLQIFCRFHSLTCTWTDPLTRLYICDRPKKNYIFIISDWNSPGLKGRDAQNKLSIWSTEASVHTRRGIGYYRLPASIACMHAARFPPNYRARPGVHACGIHLGQECRSNMNEQRPEVNMCSKKRIHITSWFITLFTFCYM